jgi:monoterpene epsilon-lactone hydrolase
MMRLEINAAKVGCALFAGAALTMAQPRLKAQAPASNPGPQVNSSVIDADGTAHITRVVPVPSTVSPEAQAFLRNNYPDRKQTLTERRNGTDTWQNGAGLKSRAVYPVNIKESVIAGVPVRDVTPLADAHSDWVLINLHGGGFNSDSGSFTESIPIANLAKTRVVAVLYRLAPEHPYPAALDDAIAVYRELLKTYQSQHIGIYGTSAGAILTAEVAVRLKQLDLPEPAALGVFSGLGDFSQSTDTAAIYTGRGLTGELPLPSSQPKSNEYLGTHDPKDPVISPVYADLHGMPPALFITSTRDMLLSGTAILQRAFLRAGDDARLVVFEGLPHAFWNDVALPESREAYGDMADFFVKQLAK